MSICFQAEEVQYLELVFKVRSSWIYFIYRFWCFCVCVCCFFSFLHIMKVKVSFVTTVCFLHPHSLHYHETVFASCGLYAWCSFKEVQHKESS